MTTRSLQSSEFILSAVAGGAGALLALLGLVLGRDLVVVSGAALAGIAAAGYAHSRGRAKARPPYVHPPSTLALLFLLLPALAFGQTPTTGRTAVCGYSSPSYCAAVDSGGAMKISGSISASNPSVGTNGGTAPGSSTEVGIVDGTGKLQGVSATNPLPITGSISASNPSVGTTASGVPASATYVGVISAGNLTGMTQPLTDTALRASPVPISGTVSVGTPAVTITSGTTTVTQGTGTNLHAVIDSGSLTCSVSSTSANQGSAAALSGAWPVKITDGTNTMPTGDSSARTIHTTVDNASVTVAQGTGSNLHTVVDSGSLTCTVASTSANQGSAAAASGRWPIYLTDGTNIMPTGDASARTIHTTVDNASVTVAQGTGTNLHTVIDSGSVTATVSSTSANQGTAAATASAWPVKVTDGTNTAAVKAASTGAAASDPSAVVQLSPNQPALTTPLNTSARITGNAGGTLDTAKGTQSATALGVQQLHNAGRVSRMFTATVASTATAETLITLTFSNGLAATSTCSSCAVTTGKSFRIQGIYVSARNSTGTTTSNVTVNLRAAVGGATTASSPLQIHTMFNLPASAVSVISPLNAIQENFEIDANSGTNTFGVTITHPQWVTGSVVATFDISIIAFEY